MKAARASAEQLQLEVERLKSEAAEACIGDFVSVLVAGLYVKTHVELNSDTERRRCPC